MGMFSCGTQAVRSHFFRNVEARFLSIQHNQIRALRTSTPRLNSFMQYGGTWEHDMDKRRAVNVRSSNKMVANQQNNNDTVKTDDTHVYFQDSKGQQSKLAKSDINANRFTCREITYFVTGKRNGNFDDYMSITEEDIVKEAMYLLPMRTAGSVFGKSDLKKTRNGANYANPNSLAIYTGASYYFDALYRVERAWLDTLQNGNPQLANEIETPYQVMNKQHLESSVGGLLKNNQYEEIKSYLMAIAEHPYGREKHKVLLTAFEGKYDDGKLKIKKFPMDEYGRIKAIGSHKLAKCVIYFYPGDGNITVNEQPLARYFNKLTDRQRIIDPFMACNCVGEFDVEVKVDGGGSTGQSSAIRLAITRALYSYNENKYFEPLQGYELFIRDPRHKERKKPGWAKARKKKQWCKR